MEETEILRAAQSALRFIFVVGADSGAVAQPASRSLPFVLTNSIASTRNAGVHPTAMTAELVLVRRTRRRDRGRRRLRDGRHFQTYLVWRHGGGAQKLPNNVCFVAPFVVVAVVTVMFEVTVIVLVIAFVMALVNPTHISSSPDITHISAIAQDAFLIPLPRFNRCYRGTIFKNLLQNSH